MVKTKTKELRTAWPIKTYHRVLIRINNVKVLNERGQDPFYWRTYSVIITLCQDYSDFPSGTEITFINDNKIKDNSIVWFMYGDLISHIKNDGQISFPNAMEIFQARRYEGIQKELKTKGRLVKTNKPE